MSQVPTPDVFVKMSTERQILEKFYQICSRKFQEVWKTKSLQIDLVHSNTFLEFEDQKFTNFWWINHSQKTPCLSTLVGAA